MSDSVLSDGIKNCYGIFTLMVVLGFVIPSINSGHLDQDTNDFFNEKKHIFGINCHALNKQ